MPPSGDLTGRADTAALAAGLAAAGAVYVIPAVYYLTTLVMTAGGKITGAGRAASGNEPASRSAVSRFKPGSAASGAMISAPAGVGAWELRGLTLDGTTVTNATPYTHIVELAANQPTVRTASYVTIAGCDVLSSGSHGVYVGTGRDAVRVDNCLIRGHAGSAVYIDGADCVISRCGLGFSGAGYTVTTNGEMTRITDCDIFDNTLGGQISASRVYVQGCSHDQQQQQAIIVDSAAAGVSLHGRFISNSLASSGTYPHADVSASAAGGVTFTPGTMFAAQEFGDTQKVSYDIFANGVTVNDYSTFAAAGFALGHLG